MFAKCENARNMNQKDLLVYKRSHRDTVGDL